MPRPPDGPSGRRPGGARTGGDASVRRRKQAARRDRADSLPRPAGAPVPTAVPADAPVRLNRFLARAGAASRREADELIAAGRVTVNGAVTTEMGVRVGPSDRVTLDGRPVTAAGLVYVLLNKPGGAITTRDDERDRRTVMDFVELPPDVAGAVFPVGRLDRETTGALLLTSDGDLAHRLMHPRYGAVKLYVVTTEERVTARQAEQLVTGVALDDGPAAADHAQLLDPTGRVLGMQLHEGRNRQVRRMIEALGHRVASLDRVGYAGLDLAGLKRGRWRHLEPHEVNALRRSVKLKPILDADAGGGRSKKR